MGANKVWILNVGDLKPAEKEIEYFADLAKNVWSTSNTEISSIYEQNAKRDFNMNETDAKEYADIMDKYYEIANANRPEFLRTGDFSMTAYGDEGERYINEYKDICARAENYTKNFRQISKRHSLNLHCTLYVPQQIWLSTMYRQTEQICM